MSHVNGHVIDGVLVPSVTEITSLVPKPWFIPWLKREAIKWVVEHQESTKDPVKLVQDALEAYTFIRDAKGDIGKDIHVVFENILTNQIFVLKLEHKPFIENFTSWLDSNKVTEPVVEPHLESTKYKYHGSPDLICVANGTLSVVDYKVKGIVDHTVWLQLAAYAQMWYEKTGEFPEQGIVLQFAADTGKMKVLYCPIKLSRVLDAFLSAHKFLQYINRKGPWRSLRKYKN